MLDPETTESARPARLSRRGLLAAAGAGALALVLPGRPRLGGGVAPALAAAPRRFAAKLPIPKVLHGDRLRVRIREADVSILPGRKTRMWTYDGTFPGPTIRRRAGEATRVTFVHDLPTAAGELTVHLHGGHNRSDDDGQPGGLTASQPRSLYCDVSPTLSPKASGNDLLISPGESRAYHYDLIEDGGPERAAFQWYHDHRLESTARNVWRGLAGMWILDDDVDSALPLPDGEHDIPMMIVDRSFDHQNQLTDPYRGGDAHAPNDGVTGRYVLVNGAFAPHHHVAGRRYRLRILNASNFRAYNLHLSHGLSMTQIATDSGLMPAPVERRKALIGPGERVEVVVDFAEAAGEDVVMRSVPRSPGHNGLGSKPYEGPIMQFRVGRRKQDSAGVPGSLRPLPSWISGASASPDRTWVFSVSGGFRPTWLVNGNTYDPARSDAFPVIDTTETWQLTNVTSVAHMIHMHHTDWYMLARNGQPPKPWEDCLKETFFLDPGDSVTVAGHFSDFTGRYVIHCHMLDHEDHGLMSQFEVVSAKAKRPAADEVSKRERAGVPEPRREPSLGLPDPGAPPTGAFTFTPEAPAGERLRRLDVYVDGHRVRSARGSALERPVRLRTPAAPFLVTAVARTLDGRFLSAARRYGA